MAVLSTKFKLVDEMSARLKEIGTAGREVSEQLQNIGTTGQYFNGVSSEAENLTATISSTSNVLTEFSDIQLSTVQNSESLADSIGINSAELSEYSDKANSSSAATEELQDKLNGTQQEYQKTQEETARATEKTEEYGSTNKKVFGELEGLIASVGIVAFLKKVYDGYQKCIEAASEYETSVAKVSTLADPNQMSVGDMSSELLELSQKTGQAASELAEAEYQALSAGVATKSAADFVEQANKLAVGGFTESATAVDVLTTALNAYQLNVSETNRVSDTLITTQNLGKTTVDELAQNMGRVIPAAAAYNVEIEDLSTAYAILTANGIATAESTTNIKGMLNELGDTGSDVSEILNEKTGKTFAQLQEEGKSLGDVIGILSASVDGNTTAFANLWSSQEAGLGALSLLTSGTEKYNSTLDKMKNSAGTATEAYQKMTDTTEYTSKALQNAGTNFQIAVGNAMLPATNKFNEALTNVLNGLTTFVNEHPNAVRAVSSFSVGLGVATAAIVGYTAVTKLAKVATMALTAVMDMNPLFLAATAFTALVAGCAAFSASQEEATEKVEELSAASKEQKRELDDLQSQYDALCESGQKNSYEAEELKYKIDDLTSSYESNKQTVDELRDSHDKLMQEYDNFKTTHQENVDKIANEGESARNLIDRLGELGTKSSLTAEEQAEMGVVIDALNKKMPSLGATYSAVASDVEGSVERMKAAVNKDIAQKNYDESYSAYSTAYSNKDALQKDLDAQKKQLDEAQTNYNNAVTAVEQAKSRKDQLLSDGDLFNWLFTGDYDISNAENYANSLKETLDQAQTSYDEANNKFNDNKKEMEDSWDEMIKYSQEAYGLITETENEAQQAVTGIAPEIINQVKEVATAYDEAYNAALSSFQNQFALWDEAPAIVEASTTETNGIVAMSVSTLSENLDTQIKYWETYNSNLENLKGRNIEGLNELVASMDDGSEKSAAALAGMANASDAELQKLAEKFGVLRDDQDKTAQNVGQLEADFNEKMNEIANDAAEAIEKMDLSEQATTNALKTINAYIDAIKSKQSEVAGALSTIVGGSDMTVKLQVPGNARGTTNAEDVFIAGEEGPELIVGKAGATVYTAEETEQIINRSFNISPTESNYVGISQSNSDFVSSANGKSEKVVTLKLEGLGSIRLSGSGGVSKSEVIDILTEQIKPVLVSVLSDEIYEEGEDSYDY